MLQLLAGLLFPEIENCQGGLINTSVFHLTQNVKMTFPNSQFVLNLKISYFQGCDFVHYTLFYINVSKMYIIYIIFYFCTLYIIFVKRVHYFINYTLFFEFLCKTRCAGEANKKVVMGGFLKIILCIVIIILPEF